MNYLTSNFNENRIIRLSSITACSNPSNQFLHRSSEPLHTTSIFHPTVIVRLHHAVPCFPPASPACASPKSFPGEPLTAAHLRDTLVPGIKASRAATSVGPRVCAGLGSRARQAFPVNGRAARSRVGKGARSPLAGVAPSRIGALGDTRPECARPGRFLCLAHFNRPIMRFSARAGTESECRARPSFSSFEALPGPIRRANVGDGMVLDGFG